MSAQLEVAGRYLPGAGPGDIALLDYAAEASGGYPPGLGFEDIARLEGVTGTSHLEPDPWAPLNESQCEIVWLAAEGMRDKEISKLRGRSPSVVGNNLSEAYGKLGITGRSYLAALLPVEGSSKNVDTSVLTPLQREIFDLVGQDLTPKQIALQLNRSAHRVRIHNQRTRERLGLAGAIELRQVARDHARNKRDNQVIDSPEPETPVDLGMPTTRTA